MNGLNEEANQMLRVIAEQLDGDVFPLVRNGGYVTPSRATSFSTRVKKEPNHERSKQKGRGTSRKRSRPPRREMRTGWQANPSAQVVSSDVRTTYRRSIKSLATAYPDTEVFERPDGMLVRTKSEILEGLSRNAVFVTGISFSDPPQIRSWGFWNGMSWIGPRHTNFPDGSICSFEPADTTWILGEDLVPLFDIYSVWALRHLYLELVGNWPGRQSIRHPYERVLEQTDNEICGCPGNLKSLYSECCKEDDLERNRVADAVNFTLAFAGGIRTVPSAVSRFLFDKQHVSPVIEFLKGQTVALR